MKNLHEQVRKVTEHELIKYPNYSSLATKKKIKMYLKLFLTKRKIDRFFWPNGLLAIGLEKNHYNTKNVDDINSLKKYFNNWIKSGAKLEKLDSAINGYPLIYLYEVTGDMKYKVLANKINKFIMSHPRDKSDNLPYRKDSENIYADGVGMISPFLCRYGSMFNNDESLNLGINQVLNFYESGFDLSSKLPYHSFNLNTNLKLGIIGWGRSVGWILLGTIDSLEFIPKTHQHYNSIKSNYLRLLNNIIKFQSKDGYFYWQIQSNNGLIDTSTTSMIVYSIVRGIELGILDSSYSLYAKNGLDALKESTKNGYVYDCTAECLGLGMYPQKVGWYPWSQGLTLASISINNVQNICS